MNKLCNFNHSSTVSETQYQNMNDQFSIDLLRERINDFYHNEGYYPKVRISKAFWEQFAHEIADLAKDNISINVVDNIRSRHSFFLEKANDKSPEIDTLLDLKKVVDKWVGQGKGHWPTRCMSMDDDIYIPIQLYAIVPGEAPMDGLELFEEFWGAPEAEHILVVTAD